MNFFITIFILISITLSDPVSETFELFPSSTKAVKIPGRSPVKAYAWGDQTTRLYLFPDNCLTLEGSDEVDRFELFLTETKIETIDEKYEKCLSIFSLDYSVSKGDYLAVVNGFRPATLFSANRYVIVHNPTNQTSNVNLEIRINDNFVTSIMAVTFSNWIVISVGFILMLLNALIFGICGCGCIQWL